MPRKKTDQGEQLGLFADPPPVVLGVPDQGPKRPIDMTQEELRALQAPHLESRRADQARRGARRRGKEVTEPTAPTETDDTSRRRDVDQAPLLEAAATADPDRRRWYQG